MSIDVKICGLSTAPAVEAAVEGGARLVGFVFFPASPRYVTPLQAHTLTALVPPGILRVGLVVDAEDDAIEAILSEVPLDLLQLHGAETPARVDEIRRGFGLPVIKALAIAETADLDRARAYAEVADRLLFDARPPEDATRPGGNARSFDWRLLAGRVWPRPWLLAGGLDADNIAHAVEVSGATGVDVSSGVEDAPGRKSIAKIHAFLAAAGRIGSRTGAVG